MAITDAAHVPAPGARDLTFEELNVHGPLFQYWVLLKASGVVEPVVESGAEREQGGGSSNVVCALGTRALVGVLHVPGDPPSASMCPRVNLIASVLPPPCSPPCSACSRCTTACPTTSLCAWPSRCWSALCLAPWPGTRAETREWWRGGE